MPPPASMHTTMSVFFAQIFAMLLPYGTDGSVSAISCETISHEIAFDTNVHVEASALFPHVPETTLLACYVNEALRKEAHECYDTFVQEMSAPRDELWDWEMDERFLSYHLSLVCSVPSLMSFYGSEFQYRGGVHGSVRYITKTFCQQNDEVCELVLDDLFLPGYREWLFRYCECYFRENRYGYYHYDDDDFWIGFNPDHLSAFLLSENGLLLIFQNYVIDGFDDYPATLLIPYSELSTIVNPDRPLPVNRLWPIESQKALKYDNGSRFEKAAFLCWLEDMAIRQWRLPTRKHLGVQDGWKR